MVADHRPPVPVPTGASLTDSEEGRAFFQARLAVMGLRLAVLDGGFWIVSTVVLVVSRSAAGEHSGDHAIFSLSGRTG